MKYITYTSLRTGGELGSGMSEVCRSEIIQKVYQQFVNLTVDVMKSLACLRLVYLAHPLQSWISS